MIAPTPSYFLPAPSTPVRQHHSGRAGQRARAAGFHTSFIACDLLHSRNQISIKWPTPHTYRKSRCTNFSTPVLIFPLSAGRAKSPRSGLGHRPIATPIQCTTAHPPCSEHVHYASRVQTAACHPRVVVPHGPTRYSYNGHTNTTCRDLPH